MMTRWAGRIGLLLTMAVAAGCGNGSDQSGGTAPTATVPPVATRTVGPSGTAAPSTPTRPVATATATFSPPPTSGPRITYFGIARADSTIIEPSGTTSDGVPYFTRPSGSGFSIVIEGQPGPNGQPVALSTYNEELSGLPDLQITASRNLGDGSPAVCDTSRPSGGVPASAANFDATPANIAAINDLACRFRDGEGHPLGVGREDACTQFPSGEFDFVNPESSAQFCSLVSRSFEFAEGDTVVTARLRDTSGAVGPAARILVRVLPPPTPPPSATATPTRTPSSLFGPEVTFLGLVRADGTLVEPIDITEDGVPIYSRRAGFGFSLVVEGRPGRSGAPVSPSSYQEDLVTFPDLQIQTSRDLGNGSAAVCDVTEAAPGATPIAGGGVPGTDPASFALTQQNINAVNDFACRFRNGQGATTGRPDTEGCVLFENGEYGFAETATTLQFCAFVDSVISFPLGETRVTVQLRDVNGNVGDPAVMIIRVL